MTAGLLVSGSLLAACSSDAASSTAGSGGSAATGSTATGTSSTGTGGAATSAPTFVTHFDPAKGELLEGLFVDGSTAYVGLATLGKIVKVSLPAGVVSDFGSIPAAPSTAMNAGFMLGIALDAAKDVYVGFGGGDGMTVKNGIYKIPAAGGVVTAPWTSDPAMSFPNGLVFDAQGTLWVADSGGAIFKISAAGAVTRWLADPSLSAAGATCAKGAPFPIGANGLALHGSTFYVSNTNLAQIVAVPILADGTAGTPSIFSGPDCNGLGGLDGLAADADGTLFGVSNPQSKLVRIGADGKVETLFSGVPLDNPASISLATVAGAKTAYLTNSAFFDAKTPAPGLLAYPLP